MHTVNQYPQRPGLSPALPGLIPEHRVRFDSPKSNSNITTIINKVAQTPTDIDLSGPEGTPLLRVLLGLHGGLPGAWAIPDFLLLSPPYSHPLQNSFSFLQAELKVLELSLEQASPVCTPPGAKD